jgi:hypothetical protein
MIRFIPGAGEQLRREEEMCSGEARRGKGREKALYTQPAADKTTVAGTIAGDRDSDDENWLELYKLAKNSLPKAEADIEAWS